LCTLIILYGILADHSVVALHNRYAFLGAKEKPPTIIEGKKRVCCPIDVNSQGTWIGFNQEGLFLAVTDQHTGEEGRPLKSRGKLALRVLLEFSRAEDAAKYLAEEISQGYRKGNYMVADRENFFHLLYDGKVYQWRLSRGIHVFTNLTKLPHMKLEGEPEKIYQRASVRKRRALELAVRLLEIGNIDLVVEELKAIASDHGNGPGETSICYHGKEKWFMSSSTIVAVNIDVRRSRLLYCRGNPCLNPFIDYSGLVQKL